MNKVYQLRNLDCANCARKMEEAIAKLDGVETAGISFMSQKLTLNVQEEKLDDVLKKAAKAIRRIEPDCELLV